MQKQKDNYTLHLNDDEVAIFGYGSLMLPESFEKTLGRPSNYSPRVCLLKGWKRSWSVRFPNNNFYLEQQKATIFPENIIYLNIEEAQGQTLNGVLWVVKKSELAAFDQREAVYDRICVNESLQGIQVEGGEVYTYRAKPEFYVKEVRSFREGAIRFSYVNIIRDAMNYWGEDFFTQYAQTSQHVPRALLINDKRRA